jgi:uroporphyrinogen-III synthase
MPKMTALSGKVVAVPESRQLDILVELLRNRGAEVLQVPLVAILDAPDPEPVLAWLRRFIADPPDVFILLTGEGLKRLLDLAGRHALQDAFIQSLGHVCKLCRGPKPERVLKGLALQADLQAQEPTTEGVIATLATQNLQRKRVAVQLYGEEPNRRLIDFLGGQGAAVDAVAPYIYAGKEAEARVLDFIEALQKREVDVVAFTSQPQYRRLLEVARLHGREQALQHGLRQTVLAAVGPLVAAQLQEAGLQVAVMPDKGWFMKPLVTAILRHFEDTAPHPL